MHIALIALLVLTCCLQIYQVQSRRVRKCYGRPVCATNEKTYSNACTARRRGHEVECKGRCPCISCRCRSSRSPVCGTDGKTYRNGCSASCKRVVIRCPWACPCFAIGV